MAAPADVRIVHGDTDRAVTIAALARAAYHQTHKFQGAIAPGLRESADYDPAGTFSNACHVAIVGRPQGVRSSASTTRT